MAFKEDSIELSTKLFTLKVSLKTIFIVIILLILFSFDIYMGSYPTFQNSVMGNDSLPAPFKSFIVITPTVIYYILLIVLLYFITASLLNDLRERKSKKK